MTVRHRLLFAFAGLLLWTAEVWALPPSPTTPSKWSAARRTHYWSTTPDPTGATEVNLSAPARAGVAVGVCLFLGGLIGCAIASKCGYKPQCARVQQALNRRSRKFVKNPGVAPAAPPSPTISSLPMGQYHTSPLAPDNPTTFAKLDGWSGPTTPAVQGTMVENTGGYVDPKFARLDGFVPELPAPRPRPSSETPAKAASTTLHSPPPYEPK